MNIPNSKSTIGIPVFLMTLFFVSCVGSSNKSDHSLIVGEYEFSISKILGGQKISGVWRLKLRKEGETYLYTIQKTITDQMYGGIPKTETTSGKLNRVLESSKNWYFEGFGNAYIIVPSDGYKIPPTQITMFGDGDPKTFLRIQPGPVQTEGSMNSIDSRAVNQFEFLNGIYHGSSIMGSSVGIGQVSISKTGRIAIYYNHGREGSATEYGNIKSGQSSVDTNVLNYTIDRDEGGNYDLSVFKSKNQLSLAIVGHNWELKASRGLNKTTVKEEAQDEDYIYDADTTESTVIPEGVDEDAEAETDQVSEKPFVQEKSSGKKSDAYFPGGYAEWRKFINKELERNMDQLVEAKTNGTVVVMFRILKDGSIDEVRTLECQHARVESCLGPESKLAKISEEVIRRAPKWVPAMRNDTPFVVYRRHTVSIFSPK
jgi:hypothetical protein